MAKPEWQTIIDNLIRLAQDEGATPDERDTARRKISLILDRHPQAEYIAQYEPLKEFTMKDVGFMIRNNISTSGSWTGRTLEEAAQMMVADYRRRVAEFGRRPRRVGQGGREIG